MLVGIKRACGFHKMQVMGRQPPDVAMYGLQRLQAFFDPEFGKGAWTNQDEHSGAASE